MPSTAQLASYALLTAVGYLATVAISRLFFSRISHIPGPKLAALTHYYQSYYDVYPRQGQFLWQCRQLHKRYGPVVRIGPDEVHVDLPEIYADMYKGHRNKSAVWFWMVGTGEFGDHTVFTTLGHDLHRLRRGALNPYFSKQMVQNLEPRIRGKVMLLKQRMLEYQGTGEPVDLVRIISGMTIGKPIAVHQALAHNNPPSSANITLHPPWYFPLSAEMLPYIYGPGKLDVID